jgi:hypothetical protein
MRHLPFLWKFRLLYAIRAKGVKANRQLLDAWARAEGGTESFNSLNTTEPWPGATVYNSVGVRNYASGADGIAATSATLRNGHYPGIVADLRAGKKSARRMVVDNRAEFSVWGTNPDTILRVLAS